MKKSNLWLIASFNIIFLIIGYQFASKIVERTDRYKIAIDQHITTLDFKDRLFNNKEWVILLSKEFANFVEDTEWHKKKEQSDRQLAIAQFNYDEARNLGYYLLYMCIGLIVITLLVSFKSNQTMLAMSSSVIAISLLFLYVGIYTPMIEISAYNENLEIPIKIAFEDMAKNVDATLNKSSAIVNKLSKDFGYEISIPEISYVTDFIGDYKWGFSIVFEGRMYYFHQCKSIDDLIVILFNDKNYIVAWAILLFSVVLPFFKLFTSILIIYLPKVRKVRLFILLVKLIGKWSMADVFVAACFLAFLSFYNLNVGIETESNTLIGLYFFMFYVILSLVSSSLIAYNELQQQKNN